MGLAMEKVVGFPRRDIPHQSLEDAEFGNAGRSDRFLPGWYILPVAVIGFLGLGAVLGHFMGFW